ncbi:MAG: hypothetical protein WBQ94_03500 [Terracidiphilus sp.]
MIRDYRPEDEEQVKALHAAMGLDYALPNLDSPLVFVKKVKDVDGTIVAATLFRITAEAYLLCSGGPEDKWTAMTELQPEALIQAYEKGLDDLLCVVPPELVDRFRKRLGLLGWEQDREGWTLFSRKVG